MMKLASVLAFPLLCIVILLSPAYAYNSEEHKLVGDLGASMVKIDPSIVLPMPTQFTGIPRIDQLRTYEKAKTLAVGFATNDPSDYVDTREKVQDNYYWFGFYQRNGNKYLVIPALSELREPTLLVAGVVDEDQEPFTLGELVALYGDYRSTTYCEDGNCFLTNGATRTLRFTEGNTAEKYKPDAVPMETYLRYIGSGLWPPFGTLGNTVSNTAREVDDYWEAGWWGDEMLRKANVNDWHWSSAGIAWYVGMHRLALHYVDLARSNPAYWNHALHYEASALHSLTDLFAFGHVVGNRDRTSHEIMKAKTIYKDDLTGTPAYRWMENVMRVGGGSRDASGRVSLNTALPSIQDATGIGRNEFLESYAQGTGWSGYALQEKDFHDTYNGSGATVRNLRGDRLVIYGDADLAKSGSATINIIADAVRASVQSLFDAYVRLNDGESREEIGQAGSCYFDALRRVPVFVEVNPVYTHPTTLTHIGHTTGNNYNGQWTLFAQAVDEIVGADVVPNGALSCTMRYEDGERDIEGQVSDRPCTTFPEIPADTNPPTMTLVSVTVDDQGRPVAVYEVADETSGMGSVEVTQSLNAMVADYRQATCGNPWRETISVMDGTHSAMVVLLLTDAAGNATEHTVTLPVLSIKRGPANPSLNPNGRGVTPLVLVADSGFDPASADLPTLRFGPGGAHAKQSGKTPKGIRDLGRDLLLHFPTEDAAIGPDDESAPLWGHSLNGEFIATSQRIRVVGSRGDEEPLPGGPAAASLEVMRTEDGGVSLTIRPGNVVGSGATPLPMIEARVLRGLVAEYSRAAEVLRFALPNDGTAAVRIDETALPGVDYWYWAELQIGAATEALLGPVASQPGGELPTVTSVPRTSHISAATPNPSRGKIRFRYGIAQAGSVSLRIYDVNGRLVASVMRDETTPAGWHGASWSGQDEHGRALASGLYFAQLSVGGARVGDSKRIVLGR